MSTIVLLTDSPLPPLVHASAPCYITAPTHQPRLHCIAHDSHLIHYSLTNQKELLLPQELFLVSNHPPTSDLPFSAIFTDSPHYVSIPTHQPRLQITSRSFFPRASIHVSEHLILALESSSSPTLLQPQIYVFSSIFTVFSPSISRFLFYFAASSLVREASRIQIALLLPQSIRTPQALPSFGIQSLGSSTLQR
ncbi:hypothetical protein LR48_Vigan347s003600 [Vigna angularis]|uniref:Uncharacterized protein n=1 Tax=Phaseolus angularis TaxID=3914 RepID=A0A0L9T8V3_PHAAN|nr:hypothetical protein LR48_Vigan347s003600 [Vigna angularis]